MSGKVRNWLIAAAALVMCGGILFAGSLGAEQWNFSKLSSVQYETNVYEPEVTFNQIMIRAKTADITFLPSADEKCRVECFEMEKVKHRVSMKDQCLMVEEMDRRGWYDYLTLFVFKTSKLTIYLPETAYSALRINTDTGDIKIPADFHFGKIEIEGDTSDIECLAKVENILDIETDTGDIKIDGSSAKRLELSTDTGDITLTSESAAKDIRIEVDTGKVRLGDVACKSLALESNTGDVLLKDTVAFERVAVETDSGDLELDACDGGELLITTDTGDVEGTLLSEKVFLAKSKTGRIDVPKTITGGRCEISTDTGDIKITIK